MPIGEHSDLNPTMFTQGLYDESISKKHHLGTRRALDDGRVFHYAKAGSSALSPGKLVQSVVDITERDDALHAAAIAAVGDREITFTAVGNISANQFEDGFLGLINDTSEGIQYKIHSHPAATAAVDITIKLRDSIRLATAATTDGVLFKSMWKDLIITPDEVGFCVGVPPGVNSAAGTVTAAYYFWIQTWGPALVLCGDSTGAAATERECFVASNTGEFVTTAAGSAGSQTIGHVLYDSVDVVDTEYHQIFLQIAA